MTANHRFEPQLCTQMAADYQFVNHFLFGQAFYVKPARSTLKSAEDPFHRHHVYCVYKALTFAFRSGLLQPDYLHHDILRPCEPVLSHSVSSFFKTQVINNISVQSDARLPALDMEHLDPHYGAFEDVKIPCTIGSNSCCIPEPDSFFRHGNQPEDFFAFPNRHGWTVQPRTYLLQQERSIDFTDSGGSEERYQTLVNDEVFIQSWLFFCLIACVVRSDKPLLKVSQLTKEFGPSRSRLQTKELNWAVDEWRRWAKENPLESKLRLIHSDLILELARRVVRANLSEGKTRATALRVSDETSLAIMILGETLSAAKLEIMQSTGTKALGWYEDDNEGWGGSHFVSNLMKSQIKCPHVRKMLKIQMGSHATLLLAATKYYPGEKNHGSRCTEERCEYIAASTPLDSSTDTGSTSSHSPYQPQCHEDRFGQVGTACQENTCSMEGPDMKQVYKILRESDTSGDDFRFPLFRVRKQSSGKIEVLVEAWPNDGRRLPFATISHVWSQGLGNEERNEVRRCQLDHIVRLLELLQMPRSGASAQYGSPLFWLDTFAIPVRPKAGRAQAIPHDPVPTDFDDLKRRSIQRIHRVFSHSAHSIVIDKDLCKLPLAEQPMEAAMKLLTSSWMRRLWTLQEAFLSKRISITFEMQGHDFSPAWDFDDLTHRLSQGNGQAGIEAETLELSMSNVLARQLRENLMVSEREARNRNGDSVESKGSMLIASAWRSVRWRVSLTITCRTAVPLCGIAYQGSFTELEASACN